MRFLSLFIVGVVFGTGISISGMANPAKVLNFFDIAGQWDPSLAFVMIGAIAVTAPGYWIVFRRARPSFAARFHLPERTDLDLPLVGGSALFGVGWGIAGFCPGGALPALGTGRFEVIVFVSAMVAGLGLARFLKSLPGSVFSGRIDDTRKG